MNQTALKKFAQKARRRLMRDVEGKLARILQPDSLERRDAPEKVKRIEQQIRNTSREQFIEKMVYTWFNRFCALRYMDIHHFTPIGVVSPAEGELQPEILAEAKKSYIDKALDPYCDPARIMGYLSGSIPSHDPQVAAYRLLILAVCNHLHDTMPFLFERMADYTELLMPDDLLSGNSILSFTREAMTPETCENVEVIGWLYQFYISEKKDEVFDGLKKNKKITPDNIPAATQLFTPHWIVRYLVENSLGRLWMLNRPNSKLADQMDYYIKPVDSGKCEVDSKSDSTHSTLPTIHLRISSPEEIRICDPACGSGHMLTYAFDLLYAIYEEEGVDPAEIPEKILTNNLYGIEIDERAGVLAAFALTMKARSRSRRFFRKAVKPNICVLKNVKFEEGELAAVGSEKWVVGSEKQQALHHDLHLFEEADNFGSLLRPQLPLEDIESLQKTILSTPSNSHSLLERATLDKVKVALEQASYLSQKYHVVIANPPYMGRKGMNGRLAEWAKDNYPNSKSDLFAMFIERNLELAQRHGAVAMITMHSWMFLSSFSALREEIVGANTLFSMAHLGPRGFDSIGGEVVQTTAFVIARGVHAGLKGDYLRLVQGANESEKLIDLKHNKSGGDLKYSIFPEEFGKIPGTPIVYWLSKKVFETFSKSRTVDYFCESGGRIKTHDNETYMRLYWEIDRNKTNTRQSTWNLYENGGETLKWYGNVSHVVSWVPESRNFYQSHGGLTNEKFWKKEGITWNNIGKSGFRYKPVETEFSSASPTAFPKEPDMLYFILGFLNTKFSFELIDVINPSLSNTIGDIFKLPLTERGVDSNKVTSNVEKCIGLARGVWDSYETSWDFSSLPLLNPDYHHSTLKGTYQKLRAHWREMTLEMQQLEEENNRIFIEAYGLQDELTPEVPLNEITLTCNPYYRYGKKEPRIDTNRHESEENSGVNSCSSVVQKNFPIDEELEARLLADTMRELVSYAVGCMFGRYALDKPGLILANQGETLADFIRKVCSGKCVVDSEGENNDNGSQLSRVDRLAEGDEFGGAGLSGYEAISQGGALRINQSSQAVSGFHSVQHSGRSGQKIDGGVSEFLVDCERFKSRDGNPNPACPALEVCNERYSAKNTQSVGGSKPAIERADEQPQITTHCPLSTIHFLPDEDNVIPMLDGDWFTDDISERFREFLKIAFGPEHYEENLRFVEQGLNIKGKRNYGIRDYFLKDFYSDHVKRYKKRPIYWMFSSPRGSFNALIYMHRYRPDTVSVVLNDYLREFRTKLESKRKELERLTISELTSGSDKTKALKEIESIIKQLKDIEEYERETLHPLATERIEIDLDDGVKTNYPKFGNALKHIKGLS